jgi:hypothetical protein
MKLHLDSIGGFLLASAGAILMAQSAGAGTFTYTNRDLILCFRQTVGPDFTSPFNFEVNLGQAAQYYNAPPGSELPILQFTAAQLGAVFSTLDEMSWSVCGYVDPSDTGSPGLPADTLWVSAPRSDPAAPAAPWRWQSDNNQSQVASLIASILDGARLFSGTLLSNATFNTAAAVRIPVGNGYEFGAFIGDGGDYSGTFEGDTESLTPVDFVETGTVVSRSDLYELRPTTSRADNGTPGRYLGYFEFRPSGLMVFVAASNTPPPRPSLAIARSGNVNTISFDTVSSASYSLRFTNAAGLTAPLSNWPLSGTALSGDGTRKSMADTITDPDRFYVIQAQ